MTITDDVQAALDAMRPLTAMYVGGMGSATHNYHRDAMARRGFPEAAERIQELWLAGRKEEAMAAVPDEYLEQTALARIARAGSASGGGVVGRPRRRHRRDRRHRQPEALDLMADLAGTRDNPHGDERRDRSSSSTRRRSTSARITLNRPEKRNAISTPLRVDAARRAACARPRPRRAGHDHPRRGQCFSAGYDLGGGPMMDGAPFYSAPGDGQWARQANDTWFSIWDLAKPVIAQIHGYAIAGATELASACDLVYIAEDAEISYPVVRVVSPPDWQYHTVLLGMRRAMELMLTGDPITGVEAARDRLRQPRVPGRRSSRTRCCAVAGASRACRATSRRSTSAPCTAPSTCGAPAPRSAPAPSSRRSPATPRPQPSVATACSIA